MELISQMSQRTFEDSRMQAHSNLRQLHSRAGGNPVKTVSKWFSIANWIPACAGMTMGRAVFAKTVARTWLVNSLLIGSAIALSACSGGAKTEQSANTTATIQSISYTGPAPQSADVQAFKNEFWVNVAVSTRCGGCHNETKGQAPEFARSDDVNQAYSAALQVVNLSQPELSRVVAKVSGGHNCWTSSASVCADILTTWIRNWASASGNSGTGTKIQLTAPTNDKVIAGTPVKTFPGDTSLFKTTLYDPILHHQSPQYCSRCHSPSAATPQKPYFASDDINEAFSEVKSKINLDTPSLSRLYVRLHDEGHNCWSGNCTNDAATMLAALNAFAGGSPSVVVDPTLVTSKGLTMYDGIVAAGGNRYESHTIARYFFKEGTGTVAHDTSGVDPAIDLSFTGSVTWSGGWGINIADGGRAQATTTASQKLANRIKSSGEFTVEAWIANANVAQENAYIASYSGSKDISNFVLDQRAYQYEARTRSSVADANGEPSLLTKDTDRDAQASLQHVVLTYDPVNGRKLYVNGNFTGDLDSKGGTLGSWDDTFALVLGNEPSGNRQWTGLIKFLAIHDRALTLDQIQQNFAAGVGERYYVLFDVTSLSGIPQSYVMFEVSQYDSYSYLFNKPTFISLDSTAQPGNLEIKGIRIGVNGSEAKVGQAYIPLDVTVSNANYSASTGQLLSNIGTVIGIEKTTGNGQPADLLFLTFEKIGNTTSAHDYSDQTVVSTATPTDSERPDIGFRTFEKIDATMSQLTGVPRTAVKSTFDNLKQQLPTIPDFDGFVSSHQIGIAQLGAAYCSAMIDSSSYSSSFFSGSGFSLSGAADTQRAALISTVITKFTGTGLNSQPDISSSGAMYTELDSLVTKLCTTSSCSNTSRTPIVAKAICTAALSSAVTTIN